MKYIPNVFLYHKDNYEDTVFTLELDKILYVTYIEDNIYDKLSVLHQRCSGECSLMSLVQPDVWVYSS